MRLQNAPHAFEQVAVERHLMDDLSIPECFDKPCLGHVQHVHVQMALDTLVQGDILEEVMRTVLVLHNRLPLLTEAVWSTDDFHGRIVIQCEFTSQNPVVTHRELFASTLPIERLLRDAKPTPRAVCVWLRQTKCARADSSRSPPSSLGYRVVFRRRIHKPVKQAGDLGHGHGRQGHLSAPTTPPHASIYFAMI